MKELLVTILSPREPSLLLTPEDAAVFDYGGREFKDLGIKTFYGFYDWLRTTKKVVIGVRISFSPGELENILSEIRELPYVSCSDSDTIEIFFSQQRAYKPEFSDDQDFLDNRFYRSDDGVYAISFNPAYALVSLTENPEIKLH